MGTDLDQVLLKLEELRNEVNYWFECIGRTNLDIETVLTDLELSLREYNEKLK